MSKLRDLQIRAVLSSSGVLQPAKELELDNVRYIASRDDWYISAGFQRVFWFDKRDQSWKRCPLYSTVNDAPCDA